MSNSTEYERFVRDIQQALLKAQKLETVTARHNVKLMGVSGQEHQIDVYWEYKIAGVLHKVAIECKLHGRKIDLGVVRDFYGVLDDIPGLRGVIVCQSGFTSGAETYAKSKNIGLKIIRQAQDVDFKGRVRTINLSIAARYATNLRVSTVVDKDWLDMNMTPERQSLISNVNGLIKTDGIFIQDKSSGEVIKMQEICNYLPVLNVDDISGVHEWEKTFSDAYIFYPEYSDIKLSSIKVTYEIEEMVQESVIGGDDVGHTLIKDAFEGTLLFVDKDGVIYGDKEKEGIA